MIALFSIVVFMKVRSMMDCCPVFDCHVGVFGVLMSVSLLLSIQSLWCAAQPLVEPSSNQSVWWRFQLAMYIVFCVCGTGISLILSFKSVCVVSVFSVIYVEDNYRCVWFLGYFEYLEVWVCDYV
jgi:hypothetical protein